MPWFKKPPTEEELERAIMYAAMLARANEHDQSRLSTKDEISAYLKRAFGDLGVKPDRSQKQLAHMSVDALLIENTFINDLMNFRQSNPGAALPIEFRERMLKAVEESVNGFMRDYQSGKIDQRS